MRNALPSIDDQNGILFQNTRKKKRMNEHQDTEARIAEFIMRFAKFEFFLINLSTEFAHKSPTKNTKSRYIMGVDWICLAKFVEDRHPFQSFQFKNCGFEIFKTASPQRLALKETGRLGWDDEPVEIISWELLLTKGLARLRNNIAHGNKAQLKAPFTEERTELFLDAGQSLINFITADIFDAPDWEHPIFFG